MDIYFMLKYSDSLLNLFYQIIEFKISVHALDCPNIVVIENKTCFCLL